MCNWLTVGCALGAHDKNASVEAHFVEKNKAVEKYAGIANPPDRFPILMYR